MEPSACNAQSGDADCQLIRSVSGSMFGYVDGFLDINKKYVYVDTAVEANGRENRKSSPVSN